MPIFSQFGEIVWQRLFNIARILQTTALKQGENENDAIRNRISDFDSTKNPINKLAMNNRRLLIESEFHFLHPVEKES